MTSQPLVSGETWIHIQDTPDGPVVFVGDVTLDDATVIFDNILVEPLHTKVLRVGAREVFQMRAAILESVREQGYTQFVLAGVRLRTGRPKRPVYLTGFTHEQP